MVHRCGKEAEKNLTNIFDMVDSFLEEYNDNSGHEQVGGVFVAVSRNNMRQEWKDDNVTAMAEHNWKALNSRSSVRNDRESAANTGRRVQSKAVPQVFECGEVWMDEWYRKQQNVPDDYYGSLLPSIINFHIATQASVFVGVDKSSWSSDVWKTRYAMGKGSTNYKYTPGGVVQLQNGGLPPSHLSCRKMKQP